MSRVFPKILIFAALALPLLNCGGSSHSADEVYYLVTTNVKLPYWQDAGAGFVKAAAQIGVKAEMVGPETYDANAEVQEFRRIAGRKPKGILVSAADPNLMKAEIDAAIAQGIPVVTLDSDAPESKRLLFVGTDNYEAGRMGARVVAQKLNGKGNLVVFTMPEQENLIERLQGYKEVLAQHPGIKIAETIDIKGDPTIAFDRTMEIAQKRIAQVDGFICLEATACAEVAEVLSRNNVKDKLLVAMDADERTLDWIQKGMIAATIAQKPYTMGFYGLKVLDDLHHYKPASLDARFAQDAKAPIPMVVDTGATLIDASNVAQFMKQS